MVCRQEDHGHHGHLHGYYNGSQLPEGANRSNWLLQEDCEKKIGCPEEEKPAKKTALEALEAQVNVIQAAVNDRVKHEELDLLKGELDGEVETLTGRVDAMATAESVTDLERRISELTITLNILGGNFEEQAIRGSVELKH